MAMIEASAKATVPVMCLTNGEVLDQSLDIMQWALRQSNDPTELFSDHCSPQQQLDLIARNDAEFKYWLDRYKYHVRFPEDSLQNYRERGAEFLATLETRLDTSCYLFGDRPQLADIAIMPFVRQFCAVDRPWFAANGGTALNNWLQDWLGQPLFTGAMVKLPPWEAGQKPIYF